MNKLLLAILTVTLASTNAFAASSVCIVSWVNQTQNGESDSFGRVYVNCNGENSDSHTYKTAADIPTYNEIATALSKLLDKGYKLTSESRDRYTVSK